MRKLLISSLLVLMVLIMALVPLAGCSKPTGPADKPTGPAEVIHLTYAQYFPPVHRYSILQEEYCKEIEEKTNGRVQITYSAGGALLTSTDMYVGVTGGVADMGVAAVAHTPGRFPVTEVLKLPHPYGSTWVAGRVTKDFIDKYKPAEWDDVHLLFTYTLTVSTLHMVDKPIHTLEDLRGMKIGCAGPVADTLSALGAAPQATVMADNYALLSKRVIDGTMQALEPAKGWKLAEVTKYSTYCGEVSVGYPFYVFMNKDKWNSLPRDIQEIITDISKDYAEKHIETSTDMNLEAVDYILGLGNEIILLTPEEGERWKEAVQPAIDKYVERMIAAGYTEKEVRGWIEFINERITYWREQEAKLGIASELKYVKEQISKKP